ncbi:glycoside hydrolase family 3 protein [Seongchinamella unica]|uniref:Glycoside hydrolase family 3 protein n=1 Tax=Seongchinamella unica TaxID=2547392 RepID=A0A4R5LV05_9GAMM|nr:glycoside hydrolase family 3 protein [Seongchinamella unica]TDG15201.1 glycoside hydrolase family 3 protein [Seongchinamella unica]
MSTELEQKVENLLGRMSLAQKVGQMVQTERMAIEPQQVKEYHIGSVLSGGGSCPGENQVGDWVDMNDAYWMASMEEDEEHLAIPIIYGIDAIHGNNNVSGATIFPHNIGLGAARDPELLKRIARVTAKEILATGLDWTFAPTLAVARNSQWGRTYESYSEDPEVVSSYAGAFVEGLQADLGDDAVVACVKHWVGDGGTTEGIDQGDTRISEAELERLHIAPYYPAIDQGVLTVMASFNSWNGDKCHGHRYLLSYVLKERMQFNGFIISDWDGIDYLSESYYEAVAQGVNAGIDMFMVSEHWQPFIDHLTHHVVLGTVPMERIDDAVRRILRVKFAFGLFDKPRPKARCWSNDQSFGSQSHREVAREAVRKSLVLLKNDAQMLPLEKTQRILVAGKSANNKGHQCGGFTVAWQGTSGNEFVVGGSSIWQGIKAIAPDAELSSGSTGEDADPAKHDVAIVVIGEKPYAEGMGDIRTGDDVIVQAGSQIKGLLKVLEPYGDSLVLADLHPEDLETITNITSRGVPVVTVMLSGRPLVTNRELDASSAFVAAWLPGSEGQGIADVLFGDHDFSGKLSFSWPRNDKKTPNIGDNDYDPLFPYGFGLDYGS